jgi:fructokinase
VLATLQYADVIKVSDEDLVHLALPGATPLQQAAQLLGSTSARILALTLGGEGASLLTRHGEVFHARESGALQVVDTVGAGDCFLAGLVTTLLEDALTDDWGLSAVPHAQAQNLLQNAIASASLCVQQRGCVPPLRSGVQAHVRAGSVRFTAG